MVQPTLDMGEAFSRGKLDPMIRESPVLLERIGDATRSRSSTNNIRYKGFPGGSLSITGANSPTSLRMHPAKLSIIHEVSDLWVIERLAGCLRC